MANNNVSIYKWFGWLFLLPLIFMFLAMCFGKGNVGVGASFGLFFALPFCLIPSLFFFIYYFSEKSKLRHQENVNNTQPIQPFELTEPLATGAPPTLKVLAFLMIIFAAYSVVSTLAILSASATKNGGLHFYLAYSAANSVFFLTCGIGLLRLKKWSFWLACVYLVWVLLFSGWQSFSTSSHLMVGVLRFAFSSIIPLGVIFFLYTKKDLFDR